MYYIGLDIHAKRFSIAVADAAGKVLYTKTLAVSERNLREAVDAFALPQRVVLEESTMAGWVSRLLACDKRTVIVAEPTRNRFIAGDEKLDDETAAAKLVMLLRNGSITAVHHAELERQAFKEHVLLYHDTVAELTRAKNRLKAKFRQHGIVAAGAGIYNAEQRAEWLAKLPVQIQPGAELLFDSVADARSRAERARRLIVRASGSYEPIGRFTALPGVGPIRAATFYAIIDTPARFASRGKFWSYCGLGIVQRKSGESAGPEHLTRRGNRRLKAALKGAAKSAIGSGDNRFSRQYAQLVANGTRPSNAQSTVARSIATTLWTMWKSGQAYESERERTAQFAPRRKKGSGAGSQRPAA